MFNPNDPELTRHLIAAQAFQRDIDKLVRERKEKALFLNLMLAEKALVYAQQRLNEMKYAPKG
jgi:hypothetical protein